MRRAHLYFHGCGPEHFGGPGVKHHHRHGGPPFGPWARGFAPGPRRRGRGDIRAAVLSLLGEEPKHGYQIIRDIGERSEGRWTPSPGSVYPTLQQLTDEGLLRSTETDGRRTYELTAEGREAAAAVPAEPWAEPAGGAHDTHLALRDLAFGVIAATRQVGQTGTATQIERAQEILKEARRRLYGVLAEDER